jgi:hypothetical protein
MKPVNDPSHTGVDAKLETLRRDVPPRNDLWPRIAAQLEANQVERDASLGRHGPARRRWRLSAVALPAVALAACVVLASLVLLLRPDLRSPSRPAVSAGSPAISADPASFAQVRNALEPDFTAALARLSPDTRRKVLQSLATIRKAEADIVAALAEDPSNPLLLEMRQRTNEHEIDLMTRLPASASLPVARSQT